MLYLPISSLNFNSIFATESVSPHAVYEVRRFGYRRNYQIEIQPYNNILLLYNRPFGFRKKESDLEEYPIILAINDTIVRPRIIKNVPGNGFEISIVAETIYFDTINFKFLFPNNSVIQTVVGKSLSSFETKSVAKYSHCFIAESSFPEISRKDLPNNLDVNLENKDADNYLLADEQFDSSKGLYYGIVIGKYFSKPKNLVDIELALSKIQNDFGGFKSDVELSAKGHKSDQKSQWRKSDENETTLRSKKYKQLVEKIEDLEHLLTLTFGPIDTERDLLDYLSSFQLDYHVHKPFIDKFQLKEIILKKMQSTHPRPQSIAKELIQIIKQYDSPYNSVYQRDKFDSQFKDKINEGLGFINKIFEPVIDEVKVETVKTIGVQLKNLEFFSFFAAQGLADSDFKLFQIVCETLRNNRKIHKGETSIEIKNEILRQAGEAISAEFGKESMERKILLEYYNLQNNRTHTFNFNDISSPALSGFTAFLINIDSAERLEQFAAEIGHKFMFIPLGYFGLYTGFAGIGKTLTNRIFNQKYFALQNAIDSVLLQRDLTIMNQQETIEPSKKTSETKRKKSNAKKKSSKDTPSPPTEGDGQSSLDFN